MEDSDLISWQFAGPDHRDSPDHKKWQAILKFTRRWKLRGFPDLSTAPVVAICEISLIVGDAKISVQLFHRDDDDSEYTKIERALFEHIGPRDPWSFPAIDHHHKPVWPGTEWFWYLEDTSQAAVEREMTFLDSFFSAVRAT